MKIRLTHVCPVLNEKYARLHTHTHTDCCASLLAGPIDLECEGASVGGGGQEETDDGELLLLLLLLFLCVSKLCYLRERVAAA